MSEREGGWAAEFLLLAAIWGASFLFMRVGALQFGAFPTAAVRVTVAALFLLPLLVWRRGGPELRRHWRQLLVVGVLNSVVPFACYAYALQTVPTGLTAILNATSPMFGALIAWAWLGERPDRWRIAGLLIGFVGVAMLAGDGARPRPGATVPALLLAIGACLVSACSYGLAANHARQRMAGVSPLAVATGSQIGAALMLAPAAATTWPAAPPDLHAWLALLAVGCLCTGVAFILYFRLIGKAGPAKALTVTFVIPVFALAFGWLFLGEPVTPWMLLCAAVVVLGTALATGVVSGRSLRRR